MACHAEIAPSSSRENGSRAQIARFSKVFVSQNYKSLLKRDWLWYWFCYEKVHSLVVAFKSYITFIKHMAHCAVEMKIKYNWCDGVFFCCRYSWLSQVSSTTQHIAQTDSEKKPLLSVIVRKLGALCQDVVLEEMVEEKEQRQKRSRWIWRCTSAHRDHICWQWFREKDPR